jgi:trk system potassium uptake protein TrkH
VLALKLAGMGWFDAVCHAMSTLSLGGFSTHDASIAYFHSPLIESVLAVFMLIGGINYMTHFNAWRERRLGIYPEDSEAIAFLTLVLGSCVLVAVYLVISGIYPNLLTSLRHAAFNVISMATDNGFVSADYDDWPLAAPLWMLLLACVACSTGSTGGGIKMIRTLILFRQSGREVDSLVHPNVVRALKIGERVIPERVVQSVLGFVHLYAISVIGLTFVLILSGLDFLSASSAIISTINNTAHGLRAVGPGSTFQGLTDFQTWVCIVSMLLGRLEIFVLLVPLTPSYWRE